MIRTLLHAVMLQYSVFLRLGADCSVVGECLDNASPLTSLSSSPESALMQGQFFELSGKHSL